MSTIKLATGQVLLLEGDKADALFIVKSGRMRLLKTGSEGLISLAVIGPREFIGEFELFGRDIFPYTAVSMSPSELVRIEKEQIVNVLKERPDWVKEILQTLVARLEGSYQILQEHNITEAVSNRQLHWDEKEIYEQAIMRYQNRLTNA